MKRSPRRSRIPSPARSLVILQSMRNDPNRSQSIGPDTRSTTSGPIVKTRFSNARRRISGFDLATSYLRDDTAVDSARKEGSWWKALGDNSPFANEILHAIDNDFEGTPVNITNGDGASTGGVSIGRRSNNLQVSPQMSNESVHSIIVPKKKFFGGRNKTRKSVDALEHIVATNARPSSDETPSDVEITAHIQRKRNFFKKKPDADKPNTEIPMTVPVEENNETVANEVNSFPKSKKTFFQQTKDVQSQVYENLILQSSDSDNSVEQVETVANANAQPIQRKPPRALLASGRKISAGKSFQIGSPMLSSTSETFEFDNWKLLPSSTMIESAERSDIYHDTPRRTKQTTERVSVTNTDPIATDNESNAAVTLQAQRSTRLSNRSKRVSSPMIEKENLNLENSPLLTISRKQSAVLDRSSASFQNRNRSGVDEIYALNNTNSGSELEQVEKYAGRSLRSRKSKDTSGDLQSDNVQNSRNHSIVNSRNELVPVLDSPYPLETSKRSSKVLGPLSARTKRMKMLSENSQHNADADTEKEIIIPETMEIELMRSSIRPYVEFRPNVTRESQHSITEYPPESGQSNGNSSKFKDVISERIVTMFPANEQDEIQNDDADNEEVTPNDDVQLDFSFSPVSRESIITDRNSTAPADVSQASSRNATNISDRNGSETIDENNQQDQQNVTGDRSSVSSSSDPQISTKVVDNVVDTSKQSQRKSNRISAVNKSINQNLHRQELQIQQDEQSDIVRQSISSKRNDSRVSVKTANNQSKQSGKSSNDSHVNESLHENTQINIEASHIQQDDRSVTERHSIVSRGHVNRVSVLNPNDSDVTKSLHQHSNRIEIQDIQQDEQGERQSIVSRRHVSRISVQNSNNSHGNESLHDNLNRVSEDVSAHQNSNRIEIEESHIQRDERNERQSIVSRGHVSQVSVSTQLTNNELNEREMSGKKSIVNKSVNDNSKRNESEHGQSNRVDVTLRNTKTNEDVTRHRTNPSQEIPVLPKTPMAATNTIRPELREKTTNSASLRDSQYNRSKTIINLSNNDQVGDRHIPVLRYTGQKDLTRKSLNKSKRGPNAAKLGSSQSKRTDLVEKTQLEKYLDKIKEENLIKRKQAEAAAMNSLKPTSSNANQQNNVSMFKGLNTKHSVAKSKPKANATKVAAQTLVDGKVYKTPKLYMPKNWVTVRLYKYLEKRLEPKYKLKTRVRSERLVRVLHEVSIKINRAKKIDPNLINHLKRDMARMDVVQTHFEFYNFIENYMPMELRSKIIPNLVNNVPLPKNINAKILSD